MASNGETNIDKLIADIRETYQGRYAITQLATICQLQQQRIRDLESEIYQRCGDLRQRVATLEQS